MTYLTLQEVIYLHRAVTDSSGGSAGLRDIAGLESAIAQPAMTFAGEDLYPTLVEKACALGFSLIKNHPFVDGNKRVGHAAVSAFLRVNGAKLSAEVDDAEQMILRVAAGQAARDEFHAWLAAHVHPV